MAHALFIPLPIHGHVNPMLQLAIRLSSLQFEVTFITTTSTKHLAAAALLNSTRNLSTPPRIRFEELDDANHGSYEFGESLQFLLSRRDELNSLVNALPEPVTLIVLDFLLLDPLKDLPAFSNPNGAPAAPIKAGFWTTSAAMLHLVVNIHTLVERGFLPVTDENKLRVVDSSVIPGLPADFCLDSTDLPQDPLDPKTFKVMGSLRPILESAPLLLLNSFDELENSSLRALEQQGFNNLVAVGPLHGSSSGPYAGAHEEEIFTWLDSQAQSSVLYVSFGTMPDLKLDAEQVVEIAHGLEASQQPFLWVLRDRSQLGSINPARGMIVPWCPQFEVLKHPSVGGFLTHCGWNSMLESVSCGVPMIGWPVLGDQLVNCKFMIDAWKLGIRVAGGTGSGSKALVSRYEVEKYIRSLMSNKEIRSAAGKMGDRAEHAMLVAESKLKNVLSL